jgi:hypothetical protein
MGGHLAHMGRSGKHMGFWWERQKERNLEGDLDVGGSIILKWILDR